MSFSPIAIVAQGCVLPGALSPDELWALISDGRVLIGPVPAGRWGVEARLVLASDAKDTHDKTLHDRGGYVQGFDKVFDPGGFALSPDEIAGLDPLFHWVLHAGRSALREVRFRGDKTRAGLIIGNLSYPSSSLTQFAQRFWLGQSAPHLVERLHLPAIDARNRFMSGLPAHLCAKALGLGGLAFALDAACASSIYAIKLACDHLHDGSADLMLAGAVNRADDLFIHQGFTALAALSPSGQSRPFHAQADGLMPAEGAALVALRRLEDARRDGDRILGVIRGIGLSNDGRSRGLLVPSQQGQVRALRAAYASAELSPDDVSMVECHATGTSVGDAVEIRALAEVFAGRPQPLPIGSLKANLGHLITAAGAAGLLKVLASFRAGMRPATPSLDEPAPTLAGTPLRLLQKPEPWNEPGPRRAAISAFGFGGNNAHLIVEEPTGRPPSPRKPAPARVPVGIVAIGARVGDGKSVADFARALFSGQAAPTPAKESTLSLKGLRFPPKDLEEALPQQWQVLAAAREAVEQLKTPLPSERTAVWVGMQCDAEIARHGARWRVAGWAEALGAPPAWVAQARDGFVPRLGAAGVIGAMPNVVCNRLNSQFDFGGPSHSVSAEQLSGVRALEIARRALEQGEIDAALVGAVDMGAEPVHMSAARALLPEQLQQGGDAALVLILKRLEDIRRDGDEVLAVLGEERDRVPEVQFGDGENGLGLHTRFGHAHAASGLLHVAAAALCCAHRLLPGSTGAPTPWKGRAPRGALVVTQALGEQSARTFIEEPPSDLRRPQADVALLPEPPLVTQPAHRAQPVVPTIPAASAVQIMEPAPALPSALTDFLAGAAGVPVSGSVSGSVPRAADRGGGDRATGERAARGVGREGCPSRSPVGVSVSDQRTVDRVSRIAHREPPTNSLTPTPTLTADREPPTPTASREPSDVVTRALEFRQQLARVHREHVEQQAAAHQSFLLSRQRALAVLLGQPTSAPPPAPTPAPASAPAPTVQALDLVHAPVAAANPRGRTFSRQELQVHAEGHISELFGPQFAPQDQHALQVRMPQPPLLLADRVVGLEAEPASMGLGTVWTETDVREDSWFLNRGFMPAGILIESGQADLFLISYLGIDLINQGQRSYRLLGCELTYHGRLPRPGETVRYDIHVDSHARQGDVRLFFFHYDCLCNGRPMLTVRKGQAGFFSRQELDDSAGVLWTPESQEILPNPRLDPPTVVCTHRQFSAQRVRAFSEGDLFACFGPGFEAGQSHVRTPTIQTGKMLLVERVDTFDPKGGPWRRGYLKATTPISPQDWFFAGHFKNDPCMPGTLMFEGCLQMMAIYLAGMGYTLKRDGWRFEPVSEETYKLQCRGQVIPTSKELVCEMFVEEVHDGPYPTVYADLLGTVDGLKAFHARRVGLRLVPDWPLSDRPEVLAACPDSPEVAQVDGFRFDQRSLLACAWGKPSEAFGPMYAGFDGPRRVARLPGPPYHFMSRVMRVEGAMGEPKAGAAMEAEYDVPASAWYFDENGHPVMPFCVLLEAALQPCGWLASYVGSALGTDEDLAFRNLDGTSRVVGELRPASGPLRTITTLKSISRSGGMILESFQVRCLQGDRPILQMDTGFGFFPAATFANQAGLPTTPEESAALDTPSDFLVDLRRRPARYCEGSLRLPGPMLLMLDRVTAYEARGGRAGLGTLRAEKDVDPSEWFFKAHFFQDPVQPGSLGLEAMLQLLQFHMLHAGLAQGLANPRFEPIATGRDLTWKYRGQVVPHNHLISVTMEITEQGHDAAGAYAVAESSLWVDGKRIYHATGLGMRIVGGSPARLPNPCPASALLPMVRDTWRGLLGGSVGPVEDVCRAMVGRFLRQLHVSDWEALQAAAHGGAIFLGNHQVTMESTVFALLASALLGKPLLTLARIENQTSWLDPFMRHAFAYPGLRRLQMSQYFERSKGATLPAIIEEMSEQVRATGRSVMVHVEGAMALSCRTPVTKMSGAFIDMAVALGRPIVPVRFVGGLPVAPVADEIDFPVSMGQQDIYLGVPLAPEAWQHLNLRDRRQRVLEAINQLGPSHEVEEPFAPDPALASAATRWSEQTGADFGLAVIFSLLQQLPDPSPEISAVLEGANSGVLRVPGTAEGQWLAELARRLYGPRGPHITS